MASSPSSTTIEQPEPSVESLLQVIADLHDTENQALQDRDLADREIRRLRREADALRRELQEVREADPRAKAIREVLDYWIRALGKTNRTKCPANGARWNKVRSRFNDGFTSAQLKKAIDGCARVPYVGPHGRQPTDEHSAKRHDDIELICRDETTVERFIGYAETAEQAKTCTCTETGDMNCQVHTTPTLRATRFGDESPEAEFVRFAYDGRDTLPHRPASKEPRRRPPAPGVPIDKVLDALHAKNCGVVTHDGRPDSWSARCPAHDDRDPSLSVYRKPDGQVLLHCFAGCQTEDVLNVLGLMWRDLWEDSERDSNAGGHVPRATHEIPSHLRNAMQQMIARDERKAA